MNTSNRKQSSSRGRPSSAQRTGKPSSEQRLPARRAQAGTGKHNRIRTLHKAGSSSSSSSSSSRPPRRRTTAPRKKGRPARKEKRRGPRPAPKKRARIERGPSDVKHIPPIGENLRVIPLGGVERIGRNMTVFEYKDDIVIVDAGFEFAEVETPGVDYLIPDVTYLEKNKDKIRGLFITHGHYDHIGAIPHIMERIGNPPVYTREFGALVIAKRQTDYPSAPPLDIRVVEGTERIKAGKHLSVRFFPLSHAIRDAMGIIVETPVGNCAVLTDVRVQHKDSVPTKEEEEQYAFFKDEDILLFMLDSTKVEVPGFSTPEEEAIAGVGKIMKEAKSRLIIGAFSSQVERIMEFIRIADTLGKKVAIDGRSMKGNVEILKKLDLITSKNLISIDELSDYPPEKIVIIATGAQGEEYSVFDRLANGTHRKLKLLETDSLVFSSSVVPGNERDVQKLKDGLYRSGAKIITYKDETVHASGHGTRGELEWIHKQINYTFFMPMHGHYYMLRIHEELARELGVPKENIIVPKQNGAIAEISPDGKNITQLKETAPSDTVMVDGFSVSGQHEVVVRDRQHLAEDGIMVIVATVDPRNGALRKSPDIIARGFVYVRESQHLLDEVRAIIKRTVEKTTKGMNPINFDYVKNTVTDEVRKHLFKKTGKSPMVVPVVIGV